MTEQAPETPGVVTPGVASAPEPVYGLDASLTTPAAMHASDPPPPDPHAGTIDTKSLHE